MEKRLLFLLAVLFPCTLFSQAGYYRSIGSGNWSNTGTWEYSIDNIDPYVAITTEGYPGQSGTPTSVLVRNAHTVVLEVTLANSVTDLTIGEGISGTLTFGNNTTARSITVDGDLVVVTGATLDVAANNAVHTLSVGDDITADGTISAFTASDQVLNVTITGTASVISGSGSVEFNNLTINHAGTSTISVNVNIRDTFNITNSATVDIGTTTFNGSGAANTFTMSTGTFQIGGTNTFPGGFETVTLTGGTIEYNGVNQTIAHQESDAGTLVYNTIVLNGSGTKTAGGALDINGSLDYYRPVNMGAFTHTVAGSWIQRGPQAHTGTGTIVFDGTGFQQINNPVNGTAISFQNFTLNGGGVASVGSGSTVIVNGNFSVTNNSSISAASNFYVRGSSFSVASGSSFTMSAGALRFDGTGNQAVDVNNISPTNIYFDNGTPNVKTITGNITITGDVIVYDDAIANDVGAGQNHSVRNFRLDGSANLQGTLTITGQLQDINDNTFSLPNITALNINGNASVRANTSVTVGGDVTIQNGYLLMNDGSSLTGVGGTFEVQGSNRLYIRGTNNFPGGFGNYTFDDNSTVYYDLNGDQTVRGNLSYGQLYLAGGGLKTVDGPLTINWRLELRNGVVANFGAHTHTIYERILNANASTFSSSGTINLNARDLGINYYIIYSGTYTFNNLNIDVVSPNASYIYYIQANLTVNGNLDMQNSAGSSVIEAIYHINDYTISNDFGDNWTIGDYIELRTGGANSLRNSVNTFASVSASANSTIYYNRTGDITLAENIIPYGNLHLGGSGNRTAPAALDVNGDFRDRGGVHTFVAGNYTHTVAGDWYYAQSKFSSGTSGTILFDGTDQLIQASAGGMNLFNNVTFGGSGTKTLTNNFTIDRDVLIEAGVAVDASSNDVDIYLGRHWTNNGLFTQTNGTTFMNGSLGNQNISNTSGSYFGNVDINKLAGIQRVTLTSDIKTNGFFYTRASNELVTGTNDLYIAGYFYFYSGATWTQNAASTIYFTGTDLQYIRLYDPLTFSNVVFQNGGTKRNLDNAMVVSGDVEIQAGATFNGENFTIQVAGDWTNAGSFLSTGTVDFNGGNQTINTSSFNNVQFSGTNTKTLGGGITANLDVIVAFGSTLDVSASNHAITVGRTMTLTGTFTSRNGLVTFNGNSGNLTSNGNSFYSVNFTKNSGQRITLQDDLVVGGNLTISSGELRTQTFDVTVAGSLTATGLYNANNVASGLTFNGSSGSHTISLDGSTVRDIIFNAAGADYTLSNNLSLVTNYGITITDGTLSLGEQQLTLNGTGTITINGGVLDVNENAILQIPNNQTLTNAGGTLRVVGLAGQPAKIERSGGTGGYQISQSSGTFHAQYYEFYNTITNGITISGGTIDATNNFSYGTFASGTGNQYLELTVLNFTAFTAKDVVFGSGPTNNVKRSSGSGVITFQDPSGTLAGAAYENDGGTLINWTFPGGIFWTGAGDGTSWGVGTNWSSNAVPDNTNNVVLNHDNVPGAYTVTINADAFANRLTIDDGSGAAIGLTITGGYDLTVKTNVQTSSNGTITMNNALSVFNVAEGFDIGGTLTFTNGTLFFNGINGSHVINTNGNAVYNLSIDASATYTLSGNLVVNNDVDIQNGKLDVSSNNYSITVYGGWQNVGLTTFDPQNGTVTFDLGGTTTQNFKGGPFYNLALSNKTATGTATKQLTANVQVNNNVTIQSNTVLDAQTYNLLVGGSWYNNAATTAFSQSGTGTVFFNGSGDQNIDYGTFATTFNNVELSGSGIVYLRANSSVDGNFQVSFGVGTFDLLTNTLTGNGGSNTFTVAGGSTIRVRANNFPITFETVNLASNSTVDYYSNINATILAITYGNLTIRRINAGNIQTKTAAGDIVVQGNLSINDVDTEFDLAGHTLTLGGNLYFPAGGQTIVWNNGTLIHDGGNFNLDVDITEVPNVEFKGTGTKRILGNTNITGDLTIQSPVIFRMDENTLTATGAGTQVLNLNNGAELRNQIPTTTGVAFPTGFDTYNIGLNSLTRLNGIAPQTLQSSLTYGQVIISNLTSVTLNGDTDIDGYFDVGAGTLLDANFNLNLGGDDVRINNYTASSGTTVTFDGLTQYIRETSSNIFNLQNVVFTGSGTKTFGDGNDMLTIAGNITVNSGVTVNTNRIIDFSGAAFTNNGTFNHTGNTFTFNRAGAQNIDAGSSNQFYITVFDGGGIKTFVNNGATLSNAITIEAGTTVDLGVLTHTWGYTGTNLTINGTLTSSSASLILNGNNPQLPAITLANLTINTINDTDLLGNLIVSGNLVIDSGALDLTTTNFNLNVGGDFTNNSTFRAREGTVTFDGNSSPVSVTLGTDYFYNLMLSPSTPVTYNLQSADNTVRRAMTVGANATLDLNSKNLTLGYYIAAGKVYTINGTLEIDENAILTFHNGTSATSMVVNGTLRVVGTALNNATITSFGYANTRRTAITINNGAAIEARHYLIEYLDENGLVLVNGSTVHATNNFSDGIWQNMITATTNPPYYYLQTNSAAFTNPVNNVNFGFTTTPTPGTHYNVERDNAAGTTLTFTGSITGDLAGMAYEDDPGGKIDWPIPTTSTWTGTYNTNWHQAANWSTASVPITTTDVTIPLVTNNPVISAANVEVKSLTITDGALTIQSGYDLDVNGDLTIGSGAGAGALIVSSTTSEITVGGSWSRGTNGIFSNGSSTVTFDASSGAVTINPITSAFNNVVINGSATFNWQGAATTISGNLTLTDGTFNPSTNNYTINLSGNVIRTGGTFSTSTNGTVSLIGGNQAITDGTFRNLEIAGTLNKTFNNTNVIVGTLDITTTLVTAAGATLDMQGNVTINLGGTFNDSGNGSHTFSGATWTNSGTYSGSGTITFNRSGNQDVGASTFYNLAFAGTGVKTLAGNLSIGNNLTIGDTFTRLDLSTFTVTNTGSGTMSVSGNQTIYVMGVNNFPSGFAIYTISEDSYTDYRGSIAQTIRGSVAYGNLRLYNATTKTLGGNITVKKDLYFNDAILDVSANNYSISVGDDWFNNSTGSFTPRLGEVIFDGTDISDPQDIRTGLTGSKSFYKITVNKTDGQLIFLDQNHVITKNLIVSEGTVTMAGALTVTVGGSMNVINGTITTAGKWLFNSTSGSETIQLNGSILNDVEFNGSGTTFTLQDDFATNGNFTLTAGTFDGNGKTILLGDNIADIITIDDTFQIGANGTLQLGNSVSFNVGASGTIYVVGAAGQPATVTRRTIGSYAFQVNGTIYAQHYVFEYMNANGIIVNSSGTIDGTNNFSNGTFTNGVVGGTMLHIENTQTMTIDNVSFPTNPGGSAFNVTKITSTSGNLTFDDASGVFAGELYDDDPNNLIDWPTPIVLTWIGGVSTDWYTAANWSASAGPNIVPTGAENVVIATAVNQPVITSSGAVTNNLTINNGASVTLSTPDAIGDDLAIGGNFVLNGTLTLTSANDNVTLAGSWTRGSSGVFNNGSSTITLNASAGSLTLDNGSSSFYNLIINATASYVLGSNLNVSNNLTITNGTLDASTSNRSVTVGNNWSNAGTFNPRSGTVTLNRSAAGTATINNGSSNFYNLTINGGASTIFNLDTNNATVLNSLTISNSTFSLNGLVLEFGDNAGTDIFNINGTLKVDANASLKLGNGALLQVQSGGTFIVLGSDVVNVATVTRRSTGSYGFIVSSGAAIQARYYQFSNMNTSGIQVSSGATIHATNNFSDGTFSDGASGGRYLSITGITSNFTVSNVAFNGGPSVNVRGTSGTGNYVTFEDATGLLAGSAYEDDDASATTGAVRWSSTSTTYTWNGNTDTDWHTLNNWQDESMNPVFVLPDQNINVIIPNTANKPIISIAHGEANDITIALGAVLTINSNYNLTVAGSFNSGGTVTIPNGSTSNLTVANNFANSGTLNFGTSATLTLTAATGIKSIALGGATLNNLTLNGGATFNLTSAMTLNGNLTITTGILDVTVNNYQINVKGNWTNNSTFNARSGRVIFDGTSAQSINAGGIGSGKRFYNLRLSKANTATLFSDIYITNNFELNSGVLNLSSYTVQLLGNWTNTNVSITPGTSTLSLTGSSTSLLSTNGQSFNNLTINKSGSAQVNLSSNSTVNGTLTVTAGTLFLNGRQLSFGDGADNMSITGTLYVDAGATLGIHQSASGTINASGTLRVTGLNASNLATVTGLAASAGWNLTVNGTVRARYALFEYSGGNGITVSNSGTIHAIDNFSNTTFQNGTGTSYLTINKNQTTTINNATFSSGPTYNVSATNGSFIFNDYGGNLGGATYENDSGPTHPGYVRWLFDQTDNISGSGVYDFGSSDLTITVTDASGGLTSIQIQLNDDIYYGNFNALPRWHRIFYFGGTAVGDLVFRYTDSELNGEVEANLRIWAQRGDLNWVQVGGSVNTINNTITVNGYTLGLGSGGPNAKAPDVDALLNGGEDFIITQEGSESSLPVELTSFTVDKWNQNNGVKLFWATATEKENYGFTVLRTFISSVESENGQELNKTLLDTVWNELTFVEGKGFSTKTVNYEWIDEEITEAGSYIYKLEQIDFNGSLTLYGPIEYNHSGPDKFKLHQNYPNPFNPITTVPFDVAKQGFVTVEIYNILGQKVYTLVKEQMNPGTYKMQMDASRLSSGAYFIRMISDGQTFHKKMMLIK